MSATTTNKVVTAAFFDGIGTAHSLPLVTGLDMAAEAGGVRRSWTTALRPPGAGAPACDWTPARSFYAEFCENGSFPPISYRRTCRDAVTRAEREGASFFCDLAVEQLLASYGPSVSVKIPSVWVVHQVPHPPREGTFMRRAKLLAANRRRWGREARLVHARSVLRSLSRTGGRFVVHTEKARDRLSRIVPNERIFLTAWPVVSASSPPALAHDGTGGVRAVFPGECRESKGLDVLIDALPMIDGVDAFDLPTVVARDAQARVRGADDERLRMGTAWLSNDDYHSHLRDATFAVLPYRTAAMSNAGISASLLDVLSVGLPAVITKPIARGLPESYGGAVVVDPDSSAALAAGVKELLANLDAVRDAARLEGPRFVAEHHSYENYLDVLMQVGTR